ncbi:MAG: type VI secretion system baseplate subunit TssF, partial [Aquisalimonadaceae bacterium]
MDDALLSYYNRELAYLRKMGGKFAEDHPKIARRLRLENDAVEDAHVARLFQSFAFLAARIRHVLDDSFPELTEALMQGLFRDCQAPIPSMCVVRMTSPDGNPESATRPRGTMLHTDSNPLGKVFYQTCFAADVLPINVSDASFHAQPFEAPTLPEAIGTQGNPGMLRLTLRTHPGIPLASVAPNRLRFFLDGHPRMTFKLYEFLLNNAVGIAIAEHARDPNAVFLPANRLNPCGFADHEAALPDQERVPSADRLLTEYFAFPEKFLFVELDGLENVWSHFGEKANIYIYFNQSHSALLQGVSSGTLVLGATPAVNLFEQNIDPLHASELTEETRLSVGSANRESMDIHTLKHVYLRTSNQTQQTLFPFHGAHRTSPTQHQELYWQVRREVSHWINGRPSRGIDTYLSFVDADFRESAPERNSVIKGKALCTNRDLPDNLPFGADQPELDFFEGGSGMQVRCVTAPTQTILPMLDGGARWQLVTQLSLQHFMGEHGLQILKAVLGLYDFKQIPDNQAVIEALVGLNAELATARLTLDGRAVICQGTRVTLEVDEHRTSGLYLFSAVLSELFAQYCTLNTFVQLQVTSRQRPGSAI